MIETTKVWLININNNTISRGFSELFIVFLISLVLSRQVQKGILKKKNEGRKNERELCRATEIIGMKESAKAGGRELP